MQSNLRSIVFASIGFFIASSAHAYLTNAKMPACLDGPDEMQVDNARVLKFKTSTKNQYLDRAFVEGTVTDAPGVKNGHDHFSISIGPGKDDSLEIIYNKEFGAMPTINIGDRISVCGDYITSNAKAGGYDASPDGAIIHWIHYNPGSRQGSATHEHGFVMVGTNLIGFDDAPAGDWNGRIIRTAEPNSTNDLPKPAPQMGGSSGNDVRTDQGRTRIPAPAPRDNGRWKPCRNLQECRARNQ